MADALKFGTGVDATGFEAGMRKLIGSAGAAGAKIGGALKATSAAPFKALGGIISSLVTGPLAALSVGIAGALAGRAIYSGISNVYDTGAALYLLHERTGANLGTLAQIGTAFTSVGQDASELGSVFSRLQVHIEGGSDAFQGLGLNIRDLRAMAPEDQFLAVARAIANIGDQSEKTAAAVSIFGRSGASLLAVFQSDAFANVGGELTGKAKIFAENAETFYNASRALAKAGNLFKGLYAGIAGGIGSSILPILNRISSLDLSGIGIRLGKAIGGVLSSFGAIFTSDDPFKYAILSLKIGLADVASFFANKIADAFDAIARALGDGGGAGGLLGQALKGAAPIAENIASSLRNSTAGMSRLALVAQRLSIGNRDDGAQDKIGVNDRGSMFRDPGIKFGPGAKMGPGISWSGEVYDETLGGALDSRRDNAGGTAAKDASVTGGLLGGAQGDRELARQRQAARKSQLQAMHDKTQKVSFKDQIEAAIMQTATNTEGLAE